MLDVPRDTMTLQAGFTSLAYAARLGHVPTMQALLAAGADPNAIGLRVRVAVVLTGAQQQLTTPHAVRHDSANARSAVW